MEIKLRLNVSELPSSSHWLRGRVDRDAPASFGISRNPPPATGPLRGTRRHCLSIRSASAALASRYQAVSSSLVSFHMGCSQLLLCAGWDSWPGPMTLST